MTTEEEKYLKYLDSLDAAKLTVKVTPSPEVDHSTTRSLSDNPSVMERIRFMIDVNGGIENFYEKINAEEIDLKLLLEEHHLTESDLNSME